MIKSNYIWELWEREWKNAYRFYHTKGNIKTKSKLKDKWYKDFVKILEEVNLIIMNRK